MATRCDKHKMYYEQDSKFGRLTIIRETGKKNGHKYCICRCDCGTEKEIRVSSLLNGDTTSCGCFAKEAVSYTHLTLPTID
jgi:hypothetical protein